MICSAISIRQICVAIMLVLALTMVSGCIESYMKRIDSNGVCESDASHVLMMPCLSYCVQACLALGQACQALSYSETDNKCRISQNCATIACGISNAKTFQNLTCPVILTKGSTIADNSPQVSSSYSSYAPEYVIDGLTEQADTGQCFLSTDSDPYVTLDLGQEYTVVYVVMWPRNTGSSGYDYVKDMDIRVSSVMAGLIDTAALCYYRPGTPTERPETFNCTSPIIGRYVRAGRTTSISGTFFVITELIVYGY